MNTSVQLAYVSIETPLARFDELDCVRLRRSAETHDGRAMPAGSLGAVIAVWAEGSVYEVEFTEPFQALVMVASEDLEREPPQV